jgi:hypothetical protein
MFYVEDGACRGADRMFKGLKREGAVSKGETLERFFPLAGDDAACPAVLTNLAGPF